MKPLNILCVCMCLLCIGSAQETQEKAADRKPVELRAVGVMRTLNTAAITYKKTYPNVGYPPALNIMSSDADSKDYGEAHAGLIEEELGCKNQPCLFQTTALPTTRQVMVTSRSAGLRYMVTTAGFRSTQIRKG